MESGNNRFSSKRIAISGMLLALTIICLYLASFVPGKLSLYVLSSFFVSVIIMEFKVKAGWAFYFASCLLSLIIPDKLVIIPYVLFFGLYGIIKMYIEMLRKIVIEYILKLICFNTLLFLIYILAKQIELIPQNLKNLPLWLIAALLQIVFLVYDYVYTLFIQYYDTRIKKYLKL